MASSYTVIIGSGKNLILGAMFLVFHSKVIFCMKFFATLPRNIIGCFKGRLILWHVLAILLTVILVTSSFDWFYFRSTREVVAHRWWFPALPIGMFLPMLLPLTLIVCGFIISHPKMSHVGWAIGQAAFIGWFISAAYKFFTGRGHPAHAVGEDISSVFKFGFYRGGIFWGWPSSHTTVAFAMALAVVTLFPKKRLLQWFAIAYALYVGIAVSMTIHWFSDFAAGAIIGTVIGTVVGKSFSQSKTTPVDLG
jgi:membrane-associated phospholipid phosphatase